MQVVGDAIINGLYIWIKYNAYVKPIFIVYCYIYVAIPTENCKQKCSQWLSVFSTSLQMFLSYV
jgi:hypothetical protein